LKEQRHGGGQQANIEDITTTSRKSGDARRIEIRLHALDGKLYITGRPGGRVAGTPTWLLCQRLRCT